MAAASTHPVLFEVSDALTEPLFSYARNKDKVVRDNDIIHLNVGGMKHSVKRSTVTQVQGSLLASMFSGRWDNKLDRDEEGRVFLDFNPQFMEKVLSYLRALSICPAQQPPALPAAPEDQQEDFKNFLQYLGIADRPNGHRNKKRASFSEAC